MVGWDVRLKDEPIFTPNQGYKLRMDGDNLALGCRETSERQS